MVKTEEDLSAHIAYNSNISKNLALISGFTFTAIVLLLNLLPNPNQPLAQLIFSVLLTAFSLIVFQLSGEEALLGYCAKIAPKLSKGYPTRTINFLSPLVWALLGIATIYTTIGISGILWAIIVMAFITAFMYRTLVSEEAQL